ncbi:MAG: sugar phosphate isomerase/epimerase [Eubacteriales bacterium]|nr:sugar phosphate isomerase/epimerase [Eubacteriales bacterium]
MMKFGCNYSYWQNSWKFSYEDYLGMVNKLADIGFDILEISADHLYHMTDEQIAGLKAEGEKRHMEFSTNSGPAKEYDLASPKEEVRKNGIAYFEKIFENMHKLGSKVLVGAIYSFWPTDFVETDKEAAWERSIACLKELAKTAEKLDVTCALEVLNRNETYILTDCHEAIEYVNRIGSKNINILLDTYHMNIEEDNMYDAIREAGDLLGHLHVGECNRKLPGMNNSINWMEIGKALRDINYDHYVVMEPFLLKGGEVGRDCRVFRDLSGGATPEQMDGYIKTSLEYLKKCCLGTK